MLRELEENELDELLEEIVILYGDELTRLAYTYVKDSETAKDIVQTVFIKCYTHLKTFKGEAKLKTWLYRITINKCKDHVKVPILGGLYYLRKISIIRVILCRHQKRK